MNTVLRDIASALTKGFASLVKWLKQTPQEAKPVQPIDVAVRSFLQDGNIAVTLPRGFDSSLFWRPSAAFDPYLAELSAVTAAAAYNNGGMLDREDGNAPDACIKDAFEKFGFTVFQTYHYEQQSTDESKDTVAFGIGYRKLLGKGRNDSDLLAIVVRGTVGKEWESNFRIAKEGGPIEANHYGFMTAATGVMQAFDQFLKDHAVEIKRGKANTKIWIVGHSRGAAVANMVAHALNQSAAIASPTNIYAYTFGTPNVSTFASAFYEPNIINIANEMDFVTKVPLQEGWGYGKYGITIGFDAYAIKGFMEYFKEKTESGIPYAGFDDVSAVNKLTDNIVKIAPTVADYYITPTGRSNLSIRTLLDTLSMYLNDKTSAHKMEFILYWLHIRYHPIADFFVKNGNFNGEKIWHAHCMEAYICYTQAFYHNSLLSGLPENDQK